MIVIKKKERKRMSESERNCASTSERFVLIGKTKNMFIIAKEDID